MVVLRTMSWLTLVIPALRMQPIFFHLKMSKGHNEKRSGRGSPPLPPCPPLPPRLPALGTTGWSKPSPHHFAVSASSSIKVFCDTLLRAETDAADCFCAFTCVMGSGADPDLPGTKLVLFFQIKNHA